MNAKPATHIDIDPKLVSQVTPEVAKTIGALLDPMTHDLLRERDALKVSGAEPDRLKAIGIVLRTRAPLLPLA